MNYELQDLIDMEHFQNLQDRLNEIYSFPCAIIDNEGNILTATGWQDICTRFHRKNKDCKRECIKSDQYILGNLHEGTPVVSYLCPNRLVENAIPIIIEGIHYGNFFAGQFFLEKPDIEFFKEQAKKYGFDEADYIEAVKKVPIRTQEQLDSYLLFIKGLIAIVSESGLKRLKEIETRKQIEESKECTNTILRQIHEGFLITNIGGQVVDTNEAMNHMLGYTSDEMLNMSVGDVVVNNSPEILAHRIKHIIQTGSDHFESSFRCKDGTVLDVEVSVTYLQNRKLLFGFIRDITERRLSEMQLRLSEERFSNLFHEMVSGCSIQEIICDEQGEPIDYITLTVNKSFERILNVRKEDVIGKRASAFLPAEELDNWVKIFGNVALNGHSQSYEQFSPKNNKYFIGVVFSLKHGRFAVTFEDITESKRIEMERGNALLKAQNEKNKTEAIIAALPDGIIIQDTEYNITYQSPIQNKLYGEHIGEHCYKVYEGRDNVCDDCPVEKTFLDGNVHRTERIVLKDGKMSYIELTSSPLRDPSGKIIAGIKLVRDITERKLAEDKIKASLKEKEIILMEIHHRVKNNMQIISSLLGLASGTISDKKYADMFMESQNRINSMSLIHENLYHSSDLAKIELNDYVMDLAKILFQSHGVASRIELITNIENVSLGIDLAIPCGLILNELITNSLKYAFPGNRNGEIKISANCNDENMITIIFCDNGIGIPSNIDFRNTQSLGLHLVTILVEHQLYGTIELDRSSGTEFKIIFKGLK